MYVYNLSTLTIHTHLPLYKKDNNMLYLGTQTEAVTYSRIKQEWEESESVQIPIIVYYRLLHLYIYTPAQTYLQTQIVQRPQNNVQDRDDWFLLTMRVTVYIYIWVFVFSLHILAFHPERLFGLLDIRFELYYINSSTMCE